jgi:hypothetical protein
MRSVVLALLIVSQVTFPRPGGRPDGSRLPDQSTISGQVRTREGEPIPVGTITVENRQDSTRADQRGDAVGWPGAVTKVKHDGTFRVVVPGGSTFQVCAEVPAKPKQCRLVDVNTNDVETLVFEF